MKQVSGSWRNHLVSFLTANLDSFEHIAQNHSLYSWEVHGGSSQCSQKFTQKHHLSLCLCSCSVTSVVYDSLQLHGPWPTSLLCSWDSPSKSTGVLSHSLPQGIFPIQGLNLGLLHSRQILYFWATREVPAGYLDHWNFSLSLQLCAFKSTNVSLTMASAACYKLQVFIYSILILIQFQIFSKFHFLVPFISFAFFCIFLSIISVKDLSKNMKSLNYFNHS